MSEVKDMSGNEVAKPTEQATKQVETVNVDSIDRHDKAITVLISASKIAFKKNVFTDMKDIAVIQKSINFAEEFITYDLFRNKYRNVVLKEFQKEDKSYGVEVLELDFNTTVDEFGIEIKSAIIPKIDIGQTFMFFNGLAHALNEGDIILNIQDNLVPLQKNTDEQSK